MRSQAKQTGTAGPHRAGPRQLTAQARAHVAVNSKSRPYAAPLALPLPTLKTLGRRRGTPLTIPFYTHPQLEVHPPTPDSSGLKGFTTALIKQRYR
jgi:hypothetical protein